MSNIVLSCAGLTKSYRQGGTDIQVLAQLELQVTAGEQVAIVGQSGAGKSTLLNMLGGLDVPSQGRVELAGQPLSDLNANQRAKLRNQHLGFVYQFHHLLGEFSAAENVAMPLLIGGAGKAAALSKATEYLSQVGLENRVSHRPSQLSGGERQRVAIARALVSEPDCVLLDEPTGNLDGKTAASIQSLLNTLSTEHKTAFIVVTHDLTLAKTMDRVLELRDGQLHSL